MAVSTRIVAWIIYRAIGKTTGLNGVQAHGCSIIHSYVLFQWNNTRQTPEWP